MNYGRLVKGHRYSIAVQAVKPVTSPRQRVVVLTTP